MAGFRRTPGVYYYRPPENSPRRPPKKQNPDSPSRRGLLAGAAAWAAAPRRRSNSVLAYIGSYTGAAGNGQGIYLFSLDLASGALKQIKVVLNVSSPSWLAIHPNRKYLYAANETAKSGTVSALAIEQSTADLILFNVAGSAGPGPAHLSVDPLGQFVFVATYSGGSIAVLPIQADPAGHFVFSTDLGQDRIYSWILNRTTGKVSANAPPFVSVPPGDGPLFLFAPGRGFHAPGLRL